MGSGAREKPGTLKMNGNGSMHKNTVILFKGKGYSVFSGKAVYAHRYLSSS